MGRHGGCCKESLARLRQHSEYREGLLCKIQAGGWQIPPFQKINVIRLRSATIVNLCAFETVRRNQWYCHVKCYENVVITPSFEIRSMSTMVGLRNLCPVIFHCLAYNCVLFSFFFLIRISTVSFAPSC